MVLIIDLPDSDGTTTPLACYQDVAQSALPVKSAARPAQCEAEAQVRQLQVGEFTLGDTDCPSLTGHPDIRY